MQFTSFEFLIFFPVVVLLFYAMPRKLKQPWLLAASYYFYMGWNAKYAVLILASTIITYLCARLLERCETQTRQKLVLAAGIVLNFAILVFFKYFYFLHDTFASIAAVFGAKVPASKLDIILPVGISFYTFQAVGYTIDVYRGTVRAERNFVRYALFVSFFPQLVAGPIERSGNLLKQLQKISDTASAEKVWSFDKATRGLLLMLWGFFMKMVIADRAAVLVNQVYDIYYMFSGVALACAAVLFAVQIYCDFASYSVIAVGAAKVLGIELMTNFEAPFFSRSIGEFWRRWHVSLSSWFRDYLYIPLGGSRCARPRKYLNNMITFMVSGLWHGADWTFVGWGAFNALLFIPLLIAGKNRIHSSGVVAAGRVTPTLLELLQIAVTFAFVTVGWIIFRSDTVSQAWGYIYRMFAELEPVLPLMYKKALVSVAILMAVEWLQREREFGLQFPDKGLFRHKVVRWVVYYMVFLLILVWSHSPEDFIYFQF